MKKKIELKGKKLKLDKRKVLELTIQDKAKLFGGDASNFAAGCQTKTKQTV